MLYECALISLGAFIVIIIVIIFVLVLWWIGKQKANKSLENDRTILRDLKTKTPPNPTNKTQLGEQIISGDCTVTFCCENDFKKIYEKTVLKLNLPMLFVTSEDDRLGTVLLEKCKCNIVKTLGKKGKPRHRWSAHNYLLLTSKEINGRQEPIIKVGSSDYHSIKIKFTLNRELERFYSIISQGCSWSLPDNNSSSSKGQSWRSSLQTLTDEIKNSGIRPEGTEAVVTTLLGRLLFQWQARKPFTDYILKKINKQLSKIDPPENLKGGIHASKITVGEVLPTLSNPLLKKSSSVGDIELEFDVRYTGGEFSIMLDLDFDVSIKSFDVEIPLPRVFTTITIQHLEGRLCAAISSVSDYVWLGFTSEPDVQISIKSDIPNAPVRLSSALEIPELTELVVTYLKSEIIQLMVLPNMEDLYIPLIEESSKEDISDVIIDSVGGSVNGKIQSAAVKEKSEKVLSSPSQTPSKEKPTLGKVKVNATSLFGGNKIAAARRSSVIPSTETSPVSLPSVPPASTPPPSSSQFLDNDSLSGLPKAAVSSGSFSGNPDVSDNPVNVNIGNIVGKMQEVWLFFFFF